MQKKLIVDYDETKKMLNTLRKLNENKKQSNILEQQTTGPSQEQRNTNDVSDFPKDDETSRSQQYDDVTVINDVEVKMLSKDKADMGVSDQQKQSISQLIDNFRQQVSQIVEFEPGITISEKQIRLDGTITEQDEDVSFVYIAGEDKGVYINADMLKLDDDVKILLEKLIKFENTYISAMEPLITQRANNV